MKDGNKLYFDYRFSGYEADKSGSCGDRCSRVTDCQSYEERKSNDYCRLFTTNAEKGDESDTTFTCYNKEDNMSVEFSKDDQVEEDAVNEVKATEDEVQNV
jgi:hypothetical protein